MKNRLLILSAATVLLGGGVFAVTGKTFANSPLLMAQTSPPADARPGWKGPRLEKFAEQLGLTDAQRAQLRQIHESTRQQIEAIPTAEQKARITALRTEARTRMEAVLTAEQRQQLQQAAPPADGQLKGPRPRISGLTDAQRAQLRQIHQETHQQMDGILSAEQKAQMQSIREAAKRQTDAVLTEQQRQQLQELRQQRQQRPQQS